MKKKPNADLGRLTPEEYRQTHKRDVVVVLDNVRSLYNIGSTFRTADSFRIKAIHLCGITATPPHREIHKTALGAEQTVDWVYFNKTLESVISLKKEGYKIYAVEQVENSIKLNQFIPNNQKIALVFGNEINGVGQEIIDESDACIEIPQEGTKHSLNVSVAVGVVLWKVIWR